MRSVEVDTESFALRWNVAKSFAALRRALGAINSIPWREHPAGHLMLSFLETTSHGNASAKFIRRKGSRWDEFVDSQGRWSRLCGAVYNEVDFAALGIPEDAELVPCGDDKQVITLPEAESWRDRPPLL